MVLVTTAVLGIVVLQLHVSDTLREEKEHTPVKTARGMMTSSYHRTNGPREPQPSSQNIQRGPSAEDEDLLDLMVRIAETPTEWERIHRVLNQLGEEKEQHAKGKEPIDFKEERENLTKTESSHNKVKGYSDYNHFITDAIRNELKLENSVSSSSPVDYLTRDIDESHFQQDYKETVTENFNNIETDTGWPDFDDAILKKIRKHNRAIEENIILERNWSEGSMLDSIDSSPFGNHKHDPQELSNVLPVSNPLFPVSSLNLIEPRKVTKLSRDPHIIRSRLYKDPKILEFPIKESNSVKNTSSYQSIPAELNDTNRTSRPVFSYHRVTTSPQERKNSAFIAVSVVKQSPQDSPVTESSPAGRPLDTEYHSSERGSSDITWGHSLSEVKQSHRKRPRCRIRSNHHNRGRRHHHTQPLSYA